MAAYHLYLPLHDCVAGKRKVLGRYSYCLEYRVYYHKNRIFLGDKSIMDEIENKVLAFSREQEITVEGVFLFAKYILKMFIFSPYLRLLVLNCVYIMERGF